MLVTSSVLVEIGGEADDHAHDQPATPNATGLHELPWEHYKLTKLRKKVRKHHEHLAQGITARLLDNFVLWRDEEKILPGEDFDEAIDYAIPSCELMTVFLSPSWFGSPTCKREARAFLDLSPDHHKRVFCLLVEEIDDIRDQLNPEDQALFDRLKGCRFVLDKQLVNNWKADLFREAGRETGAALNVLNTWERQSVAATSTASNASPLRRGAANIPPMESCDLVYGSLDVIRDQQQGINVSRFRGDVSLSFNSVLIETGGGGTLACYPTGFQLDIHSGGGTVEPVEIEFTSNAAITGTADLIEEWRNCAHRPTLNPDPKAAVYRFHVGSDTCDKRGILTSLEGSVTRLAIVYIFPQDPGGVPAVSAPLIFSKFSVQPDLSYCEDLTKAEEQQLANNQVLAVMMRKKALKKQIDLIVKVHPDISDGSNDDAEDEQ